MKNLRVAVACAFCLTVLAVAASAQMGMGMRPSMPQGIFNPTVGAGAQYDATTPDGRKAIVETTVVGHETVNGKDAYWLEMTTEEKVGQIVLKTLFVPGATDVATRAIMQIGKGVPMEMPQNSRTASQASPKMDIRSESEDVGKESVTTPAGTFACEHYRAKDGSTDTWVSAEVSPFGVVKSQGKSSMVLTKLITGAHDKIVGTPVPFNPQLMMQQMQ